MRKAAPVSRGRAHDQHVEQDLPLRREKPGVARLALREPLDVVGQQALQKARRVFAVDLDDAAVPEQGSLVGHGGAPVALAKPSLVN